jgi:hypothetical protein
MQFSDAPKFLLEKRAIPNRKARSSLKTARKRAKKAHGRFDGDTGTPEMKQRQKVVLENRGYSSTGYVTSVGARVEAQLPHDLYRIRRLLDRDNEWRNQILWQAAERLRQDFEASGLQAKMCSSFAPRVSGGVQQWSADKQVDALKRYKKAVNAVGGDLGSGAALRSALFYVVIEGVHASDWARRNAKTPQVGIEILRLALLDLAHHYGIAKKEDRSTIRA